MQALAWTTVVGRQSLPTVLNSLSRIRDGKNSDPGSGINIPDPKNTVGDAGLGMDNGGGPAVSATSNGLENLTGQVFIIEDY